jgi:hypothetical protein
MILDSLKNTEISEKFHPFFKRALTLVKYKKTVIKAIIMKHNESNHTKRLVLAQF